MKKEIIFIILVIIVLIGSCVSSGPAQEAVMILLHGEDAELVTDDSLMYEDYEGRYCVGHWKSANDQIIWSFEVAAKGNYKVYVRVACGDAQSGSAISVMVDDKELTFEMPDTGVWETYKDLDLGTVNLTADTHTIVVQGRELIKTYYGNLQSISLIPQNN
jgi:hypothetical protein